MYYIQKDERIVIAIGFLLIATLVAGFLYGIANAAENSSLWGLVLGCGLMIAYAILQFMPLLSLIKERKAEAKKQQEVQ